MTAVDTSTTLLDELREHAKRSGTAEAIRPVHGDIHGALPRLTTPGSVAAVVCMGDTLPHLSSRTHVQELITDIAKALRPGGSFVATYRDLTHELIGPDRFIPVRSTADRILTCFLDYPDENTVQVHDLLHTRHDDGWQLKASSYPKLRLAPQWVTDQCRMAGLDIRHDEVGPAVCASCTPSSPDIDAYSGCVRRGPASHQCNPRWHARPSGVGSGHMASQLVGQALHDRAVGAPHRGPYDRGQ
ncbi:class I SAM-dependent methyltransferase [Streptomyces sp. FXJ1.4098]|nr:class I SAM-dependent methyltransferase [Streptomyces sp. FXJ1.4098]